MCKDMADINTSIAVRSKGYHISFSSDAESIYSRVVSFGEINEFNLIYYFNRKR